MIATSLRGFYENDMKSVVQDVKNKEVGDQNDFSPVLSIMNTMINFGESL